MLMNWKTTIAGLLAAIVPVVCDFLNHGGTDIKQLLMSAAMAGIGIFAKDHAGQ